MFKINQYWGQARARARKRTSLWNLLIFVVAFIFDAVAWWALAKVGEVIHLRLYPGQSLQIAKGIGPILTTISPLIIVVPIGFFLGNFCIWLIASARLALDREAGGDPHMTFRGSQRELLKLATATATVVVIIMAVGIMLPWV